MRDGRLKSVLARAPLGLEVVAVYGRVRWLMWRRADVRDVLEALRRRRRSPRPSNDDPARLARAVARTLRPLPADTRCLAQSLTLAGLLARRGRTGRLVIASRPAPFLAHAWVELDGRPLLPRHDFADHRLVEL